MDTPELVLEYAKVLTWPTTALGVGLVFRASINNAIARITKLKTVGVEAELANAEQTIDVAHVQADTDSIVLDGQNFVVNSNGGDRKKSDSPSEPENGVQSSVRSPDGGSEKSDSVTEENELAFAIAANHRLLKTQIAQISPDMRRKSMQFASNSIHSHPVPAIRYRSGPPALAIATSWLELEAFVQRVVDAFDGTEIGAYVFAYSSQRYPKNVSWKVNRELRLKDTVGRFDVLARVLGISSWNMVSSTLQEMQNIRNRALDGSSSYLDEVDRSEARRFVGLCREVVSLVLDVLPAPKNRSTLFDNPPDNKDTQVQG